MVSKNFFFGCLLEFVEYLRNRSSKRRTNQFQNLCLILIIVNYRNWLDASTLLILIFSLKF